MRYENWPNLLEAYIDSKRNEPFKWGTNDCALFAKGAIEAVLVESSTSDLVIRYRSATGAMKWLVDHEADDLWDYMDKHFERIPVKMAQRGDLIGHITTDKSLGVCLNGMFATPSDNGLMFVSMDDAVTAWRIN